MLNQRQARWAQELAGYDFKIFFRPGRQNGKADYLSRRPEYQLLVEKGGDKKPETILKPNNISEDYIIPLVHKESICTIPPVPWRKEFLEEVRSTAQSDEQYKSGLRSHSANPGDSDYIKPSENLTVENCQGPSLDNVKALAMGHGSSLDDTTPVTTPAATSIAKLPTVAIGKHDLSFESHSIQNLDALADVELLWDVRGEGAEMRQRERG